MIFCRNVMPSILGISTSRVMTSGASSFIRSTAMIGSAADAMTSISGSSLRISVIVCRTTAESSTTRTRIFFFGSMMSNFLQRVESAKVTEGMFGHPVQSDFSCLRVEIEFAPQRSADVGGKQGQAMVGDNLFGYCRVLETDGGRLIFISRDEHFRSSIQLNLRFGGPDAEARKGFRHHGYGAVDVLKCIIASRTVVRQQIIDAVDIGMPPAVGQKRVADGGNAQAAVIESYRDAGAQNGGDQGGMVQNRHFTLLQVETRKRGFMECHGVSCKSMKRRTAAGDSCRSMFPNGP